MSVVVLCSGGLDSALMAALFREQAIQQWPLFIDYGQLSAEREYRSCVALCGRLGLESPEVFDVRGYASVIKSGLTDASRDVFLDAFTPGRNLLFLTLAASYAHRRSSNSVAIGLLKEDTCLFPDQSESFINAAELVIREALGTQVSILMPLRQFSKRDVVEASRQYGIGATYSCHAGSSEPCGICVACREYF